MSYTLILLRHGQSEWNEKNLFTGWVDVSLTAKGRQEAQRGGELLKQENILPDIVFTSRLTRAITTANLALEAAGRLWIDVHRSWRLNERHYGALQGKDKAEVLERYGAAQFKQWRRSYDIAPPALETSSEFSQYNDSRYAQLKAEEVPHTECLKDVLERMLPYWKSTISQEVQKGKTVLVAAHGNSLRALVKYLDNISDEKIAELNIPTGIPLVYELSEDLKPLNPGGRYLDPEVAAASIAAVADQGQSKHS